VILVQWCGIDADFGAPDTPEGRFELYTLHVALLVRRLSGEDPEIAETRQGVFDAFVRNLDDGLREMGVGDLSVGKKMRKLGAAVYGRLRSYSAALTGAHPAAELKSLIERTVFAGTAGGRTESLVDYVLALDTGLSAQPTASLLKGEVTWPAIPK
jgi:cytochrome b pre-mRNA-processing protein 3